MAVMSELNDFGVDLAMASLMAEPLKELRSTDELKAPLLLRLAPQVRGYLNGDDGEPVSRRNRSPARALMSAAKPSPEESANRVTMLGPAISVTLGTPTVTVGPPPPAGFREVLLADLVRTRKIALSDDAGDTVMIAVDVARVFSRIVRDLEGMT